MKNTRTPRCRSASPSSAARALFAGAPYIERVDRLVQAIAQQKGMQSDVLDRIVASGRRLGGGQSAQSRLVQDVVRRALLMLAVPALFALTAGAQDYPRKPIRLIVPYPPGGANDNIARPLVQKLGENMVAQVILTTIEVAAVRRSAPTL